ncbi:hypothetical protein HAX54_048586 [Datura stramonium]|uniref:Uncharacterized protein n=1 Tax=Datura stramonium TaxID=4076 RepID=A0ABS8WLX4_DATST|nr:hypothetical protein [Datura stramonium]
MESSCNSEESREIVATFSRKDKRMTQTQKGSKRQKRRRDSGYIVNEEDDDKAEVEEKILALQKIVPGGESLGVDVLFEETAGLTMADDTVTNGEFFDDAPVEIAAMKLLDAASKTSALKQKIAALEQEKTQLLHENDVIKQRIEKLKYSIEESQNEKDELG